MFEDALRAIGLRAPPASFRWRALPPPFHEGNVKDRSCIAYLINVAQRQAQLWRVGYFHVELKMRRIILLFRLVEAELSGMSRSHDVLEPELSGTSRFYNILE